MNHRFGSFTVAALCAALALLPAPRAGHAQAAASAEAPERALAKRTALSPPAGATPDVQDRRTDPAEIEALLALALDRNPALHAAERAADAARARVSPAGTLPDPMVSLGIMNLPISNPGFDEPMTMNALGVGQRLPYPGKLGLARRAAALEAEASEARVDAARLQVVADVRRHYYELAYLDRAWETLERNQALLVDFISVTESRYAVGTGGQQDILGARVEAARLAEEAVVLSERRRGRLAALNAMLDRPMDVPVGGPRVPDRIAAAAVPAETSGMRFTTDRLGARAADSPLPALETLLERAVRDNPDARALKAEIAAQAARLELAGRSHLPDFDILVQYGQRMGRSDMASVMVSVPVPLRRSERQEPFVAEARAELAAMEARYAALLNGIRASVAEAHADAERDRARLALIVRAILPQGQAALSSATAAFQVDRADFLAVLDSQSTLYDYETAYHRALMDFASSVAELERLVGGEVLP